MGALQCIASSYVTKFNQGKHSSIILKEVVISYNTNTQFKSNQNILFHEAHIVYMRYSLTNNIWLTMLDIIEIYHAGFKAGENFTRLVKLFSVGIFWRLPLLGMACDFNSAEYLSFKIRRNVFSTS